jgi:hypothetical protein
LLAAAERFKRKAATAMNERSSRAHSLVMLSLVQRANGTEKRSRLFLADLGGSEKLSRSKAADGFRSKVQPAPEPLRIKKGLFLDQGGPLLGSRRAYSWIKEGLFLDQEGPIRWSMHPHPR